MFSKGQVLSGRYRLVSLQGQGGMALVYRAYDLTLERTVALKVLRPGYDAGDAFRHEARAIARLPHPNIVTVFDVGQHDGANYIVMEFVEGQNLKQWIASEAPFRTGRALDIIVQVCEAVAFAHEQGILHCDLKPQNVLILPNGQVKVADFGIARVLSTASMPSQKAWGTPHYASPELIAGKALTAASDVYAIGVMLYEMLAGRPPFEGQNAVEIARQHALDAPPPIQRFNPRVPHPVAEVIDRALAKNPTKRHPTVKQLGLLLAAYRRRGEAVTEPLQPTALPLEPVPARDAGTMPRSAAPARPEPDSVLLPKPGERPARPLPVLPQSKTESGIDWPLLLLAALAFVAVVGLVPLWATVISRAIGQQSAFPTPTVSEQATPTPTSAPQGALPGASPTLPPYVTVPDLIGRSLDVARQLAQETKLELVVGQERHDMEVPASHVIAQAPSAGELVLEASQISVVASLGPEMVVMPDVVGFPLSVRRLDLDDLGLVVAVTDTMSSEPAGLIVRQQPAAGKEITVGSTVTLSISTGSHSVVEANFDDKLVLYSAELNGTDWRPGDTIQVVITWHVLDRLPARYTTFIHITGTREEIVTQLDRPPLGGSPPTDAWRAGEKFIDPYSVPLPADMRPGTYSMRIGLYAGNKRLPILDPGSARADGDALVVHEVVIKN